MNYVAYRDRKQLLYKGSQKPLKLVLSFFCFTSKLFHLFFFCCCCSRRSERERKHIYVSNGTLG